MKKSYASCTPLRCGWWCTSHGAATVGVGSYGAGYLSVTYGKNLDSYSNEKVVLLGDREEARGDWSVKTKIARGGGNDDILVDYRLRKLPGTEDWKIIDVTIEGVSLVANFRSQFQEIMASGGAARMLALLAEKNAKGESILPPEKRGGPKAATATAQP